MASAFQIVKAFSHLFFPDICYGCGSDLVKPNQILCLRCLHQLPYTNFQQQPANPVEKIFWGRIRIQNAASLFYFTKDSIVERLLHQLKYGGKKEVGIYCGRLMGHAIKQSGLFNEIDALVPLPLFKTKEHKRGYNQSNLLCEGIAEITGIPVWKEVIERSAASETQTHKNRVERWKNIKERFSLKDADILKGKHVLLVDDVITTGATLEACGTELLKAGEVKVSILTLAYSSSKNV
jgi:ComF family protein